MRVTFVTPTLGNAFGLEKAIWDSSQGLREMGHATDCITGSCSNGFQPANVHTIERLGEVVLHTGLTEFLRTKRTLLATLEKLKPDVVHFCDLLDHRLVAAVAERYKIALTAHTVAPSCPASHRFIQPHGVCQKKSGISCLEHHRQYGCLDYLKSDLHRGYAVLQHALRKQVFKKHAHVAAISRFVSQTLIQDGWPQEKIQVVYNPVRLPTVSPASDVPENLFVIAARLVPLKGIAFALKALAPLSSLPWTLWICGTGSEGEALQTLTENLGISQRVRFLGQTLPQKTLEIIAASRALIQTNAGPEGFGLSVAEAGALGIPVIGFDIPALNEIIESGKTGELCPLGDVNRLTAVIEKLICDPKFLSEAKVHGPRLILERFSMERHLQSLLGFYKSFAARPCSQTVYAPTERASSSLI